MTCNVEILSVIGHVTDDDDEVVSDDGDDECGWRAYRIRMNKWRCRM